LQRLISSGKVFKEGDRYIKKAEKCKPDQTP